MSDNDTTVQDTSQDDAILPDEGTDSSVEESQEESQADETKESEAEDTKSSASEDDEAKEATKEEDKDESEEQSQDEPEKEETPDQEKARRAYQNRQKTRQAVAAQVDQLYGPQSQEDLVNNGMPEADAKIEALRQEMQYRDTRNFVSDLNAGLQVDAESVLKDIPVFNPDSPEFDKDFAKEVETAYKQAARLQTDENGIVINAEIPLYDFFERMAKIRGTGVSKGSKAGQKNALKMLSRTETPGRSSSTKSEDKDPGLEAFENEFK